MKLTPVEETRCVDELHPHERNYNQHPPEQVKRLRKSLQSFGQVRPIVITESGTIVAGHGLYEAAVAEQYHELRCTVLPNHWSEQQVVAYLVADNETRRGADPDNEVLASLLRELQVDFDLEALGFTDLDVSEVLGIDVETYSGSDDDYQKPWMSECPSCGHRWVQK